ncbi:MAG TPA: hypothetical protein VK915_11505 [Gaiellaceae bacterium]|nr:hypothetical protein [Gaiellaceae bacterium]
MSKYVAELELTFECESLEAVGAVLRRLSRAAESAGFDVRKGKAAPAGREESKPGETGPVPPSRGRD